ncbi:MAG: VOC family protein [Acidimicrobiia bacterium]|nr:VOC family protein [Acidimicrobiia bacterium]
MSSSGPVISPMIVVGDGRAAIEFYKRALGASERWVLGDGQVACLDVQGAPLLLSQENPSNKTLTPLTAGATTVRIELFVDDPGSVIERAVAAGATDAGMQNHERPWGLHRQGGFTDPWGQPWLVGDRSPITGPS